MNTNTTRNSISRSAAIKRAREQVTVYRQGRGWVVSVWDEGANAFRVGQERDYWQARKLASIMKLENAMLEMGYRHEDAYAASAQLNDDCGQWTDYVPR